MLTKGMGPSGKAETGSAQGPDLQVGLRSLVGYAAVLLSGACVLTFGALLAVRSGAPESIRAVLIACGFALWSIWLPAAALAIDWKSELERAAALAVATGIGLFLPIVGVASGRIGMLVAISCIAVVFYGYRLLKPTVRGRAALLLGLQCIGFAGLLVVAGAPARLFMPETIPLGIGPSDNYFHGAIAHMIAVYGSASVGGDGLAYHHYYFLSHAVAAGTAKASGMSVIAAYTYWGAITLKVQLIWSIFLAIALLTSGWSGHDKSFSWGSLAYAWLIAMLTRSLESESFVLAMAMFVGLLPLYGALIPTESIRSPQARPVALLIGLAGAFACAATKVSVGFYCAAALGAAALHLLRSPLSIAIIGLGLAALAVVVSVYLSPYDNVLWDAGWKVMLASYSGYFDWNTLVSYALPALIVFLMVAQPVVSWSRTSDSFGGRFAVARGGFDTWGAILRVWRAQGAWQLIAFFLVATLAVLFAVPIGSAVAYFSLVLLVAACVVLPSIARAFLGVSGKWVNRVMTCGAICVALVSGFIFTIETGRTIASIYHGGFATSTDPRFAARTGTSLFFQSLKEGQGTLGLLHRRLPELPWPKLLQDIERRKIAGGGDLVVHIRPDADDVWRRLQAFNPWWCIVSHSMIPAETGIAQVRSMAPKAIERQCTAEGLVFYGFGKQQDAHRTGELGEDELCAEAAKARARRVYVVQSISALERNSVLQCK